MQSAEVSTKFSQAYDAAPPPPRPVKSNFYLMLIAAGGMQQDATSIAPLNEGEDAQNDPNETCGGTARQQTLADTQNKCMPKYKKYRF